MNKKKILQLIAFILTLCLFVKVMLLESNRDSSKAASFEEVERAYSERNSEYATN